ncbi:MAG: hypothetical protein CVU48_04085 [Candidatus Cloacimonetes bacterium HGW-Cloacimonetes-1]|nr:MAG: hypothetical protein CVU48_04085 [Candidatus Cloacimonetes bacterium HGW-Cloacimonetes-1]
MNENEQRTYLLALDILCPISIMSYISFCETMLNENKTPFSYFSFRTLDVMLKIVAFRDTSQLVSLKLDVSNVVSMHEEARTTLETEEAGFFDQYPNPHPSEIEAIVRNAIIHLTNHQFVQIPDQSIFTNWIRLDFILNVTEPKFRTEIQRRFPTSIDIKTTLSNLIGMSCRNIYTGIKDLTENLLSIYKDTSIYYSLKACTTADEYKDAVIQVLDSILQRRSSSATFLHDVSQLMSFLESHHSLEKLMTLLSQSIFDLRLNYSVYYHMAQTDIPGIQTSSYRYESPLLKHPLVQVEDQKIIPNFYDLFTCLREFPIRFNEYLDSELNANTRNTMGLIYEFYVGDLLEFTLEPERYIIIPEFEYQRSGSVVRSPDFVVIDRIDLHVIVIEIKGTRTSNVVRDDPASIRTHEYVERVSNVLKKTLTKIDELFSCVGDYSKHREVIHKCTLDKTIILQVQKDFGVLIPSLVHGELTKLEPALSDKGCSFNYCLIDIPYLEIILHNHKATGKPLIGYLRDYHKVQIGKTDKPVSVAEWIPIEHDFKTLIYVSYLYDLAKKEV